MYSVSNDYKERMMHHGTHRRLTGMIGNVSFTQDDVVKDSFLISLKAAEESDMKVGGVYIGELSLSFVPSFIDKVDRDEYVGKEVSISIGLWIPDEENANGGSWEDVPCGVFTLDENSPQLSREGIAISGSDHMAKFDKKMNLNTSSSTIYGYLSYACQQCGVELGNTEQEILDFYNGSEILPLDGKNDCETYRDLIYWLAQSCGRFACCDRTGKLVLRKFGNTTDITLDAEHRDNDVVFSGYTTKWTGISFIETKTAQTKYYGLEIDDGLTMNLGANPFMQLGSASDVDRRRRNVLQAVSEIQYTPFYCNSARDPSFDLGDEIEFTGGLSGDSTGCIMSLNYSMTNFNIEGYGDNPTLTNARSKTDKNISGLLKDTVENATEYYFFTNLDEIDIEEGKEIRLAKLYFVATATTTVKINHEFIFDMIADLASDSSYELRYYLDNELITYKPTERLGGIYGGQSGDTEFTIARDFFYLLRNVAPNITHTWEVKILTNGITADIDIEHLHITLEGQKLYSEDYIGGYLEVEDDIELFDIGYMEMVEIEEGTGSSEPKVIIGLVTGYILTEAGDVLNAENGDKLITDADTKISALPSASAVNSDAEFPITQSVSGTDTTLKANIEDIGDYIAGTQTFAGLNTTAKTLVGAINEILANQ